MKSKIQWLVLMLILVAGTTRAQDSIRIHYRHIAKLNLPSAAFKKVTLGYEFYFNDRWSAQIGGGYKFGGGIPKFFGLGELVATSNTNGIRGYSVYAAGSFHFKDCDCGNPTGLYAGPYINASKLWGDLEFSYWNGSEYIDLGGAGALQEYGIGIQLGYQIVIKKRFLVDMMFMGPRTSFQRLKLELDSQFAADVIPLIEDEINQRLEWWGMDPISIPVDPSAVVDFRFNNFRYAISIGFMF